MLLDHKNFQIFENLNSLQVRNLKNVYLFIGLVNMKSTFKLPNS